MPSAEIISIQKLPYAELYEVAVQRGNDKAVYYSDALGQIMIIGNLIEMRTDRNLTEERMRTLSAIDWNQLPFHWAITTKRGDGRRKIAIFSDPNCPFCRKFEKDLAGVDNITIHIFMWPVIKPESVRQTKSVWCSKDRAKAWNDLMRKGIKPTAPTDCENPIEELVALGKRLGARSTPTSFLPNGEKYVGAVPMSRVVPLLDATARRASGATLPGASAPPREKGDSRYGQDGNWGGGWLRCFSNRAPRAGKMAHRACGAVGAEHHPLAIAAIAYTGIASVILE